MPEVITVDAAAKIAGVSRGTIVRYISAGELKAVKIRDQRGGRGKYEIEPLDLTQWIANRKAS